MLSISPLPENGGGALEMEMTATAIEMKDSDMEGMGSTMGKMVSMTW